MKQIIENNKLKIQSIIKKFVGVPNEDLEQEIFFRVWKRLDIYKEQNKFAETIVSVTPLWKSDTRVITGNTIDISDMVSTVTSANENIVQRTLNCWVDNNTKFTILIPIYD